MTRGYPPAFEPLGIIVAVRYMPCSLCRTQVMLSLKMLSPWMYAATGNSGALPSFGQGSQALVTSLSWWAGSKP
jgi:hypothetical protein